VLGWLVRPLRPRLVIVAGAVSLSGGVLLIISLFALSVALFGAIVIAVDWLLLYGYRDGPTTRRILVAVATTVLLAIVTLVLASALWRAGLRAQLSAGDTWEGDAIKVSAATGAARQA
jgi:hypothetical protein